MLSRLKFDIKPLVNEMLDRLPADVWTRTDTTFLDPAMAGGQFIVEIIARLTAAGHSEDNIASRVSGLADSPLSLMFTQNKYKIRGQFSVGGIETLEQWVMASKKFDVVIGNPPYQDNTEGNGNNIKLWTKFVELSHQLVGNGGYVAYVTPLTWQAPISRVNPVRQLFNDNNLLWVNTNISHHFDVGSTFSAWVYKKGARTVKCTEMNGVDVDLSNMLYVPNAEHLSIHQKIVFNNTNGGFDVQGDETANVILTKKKPDLLSREKTATHTHEAFHTNRQSLWSSRPLKNETDEKVIFTTSGYVRPVYDQGCKGVSNTSRYILTSNKTEADAIVSLLSSKAYQFIMETAKWGGFVNVNVIKSLPKLDLSRSWTDAELYAHFNLTQEEIDLIEATIK